ncbi:SAM-dependent methyltransferase YafE (UbiE paralog) [hydrothermal vent metagenome]|uniref:SAM-dependent methyltransferase YafE (UbiE paralog) n=1 Tax=hydrothermal vent metagenome TaxID=652676 RepID=A0A3B0V045_9ZZZZ
MSKQKVKQQFGVNAAAYATSTVHAKGHSLTRLVELTQPQLDWKVLDVATAAGHTAFAFAPHVVHVTATDLTPEMLTVASDLAAQKGLTNVTFELADAEELPYSDGSFDLVTCRIAPHHFPSIQQFLYEAARLLKPNGLLAVVDNIVPGTHLRGKKARLINEAGKYINAFERLRDPSHGCCWSLNEWIQGLETAVFTLEHQELLSKEMAFGSWAARMQVSAEDTVRLKAMLVQAPTAVSDFLTPQISNDKITFRLTEAILIGKRE